MSGDNPASLRTLSDVVVVDVKTEDEYVESSVVSDKGLAILVDPSVLGG